MSGACTMVAHLLSPARLRPVWQEHAWELRRHRRPLAHLPLKLLRAFLTCLPFGSAQASTA